MNTIGHSTKGDKSSINGDISINVNRFNKRKSSEKKLIWWKVGSIISIVLSVTSVITTIFIRVDYDLEIVSQLLVITFIGGLATFVVISNYMQIKEIKDEFNGRVKEIRDEFDDKVKEIKDDFSNVVKEEIEYEFKGKIEKVIETATLGINERIKNYVHATWNMGGDVKSMLLHTKPKLM
jgi:hypothetical protein